MRGASAIILGLLIGALLAGCGSGTDSSASPGGSDATTTETASTTSEAFTGSRGTVTGKAQATATALLERIDVARHEGFDRVVFRFRGEELPGYRVGFVERPLREDGSGNEVALDGGAILGVRLEPASGFDVGEGEGTMIYKGPKRIDGSQHGTQVITELARTGDFEAVLNWAIGLDRTRDFRVLRLDAPARLVVDVES